MHIKKFISNYNIFVVRSQIFKRNTILFPDLVMGIIYSTQEATALRRYNDYSYEEIYNESVLGSQSIEEKIEELRSSKVKYKYVVKTIKSGDMIESEIYPVYERKNDTPRVDKEKDSKDSQKNLNDRNARKKIVRLVNANFGKNSLALTLTYQDKYLPTESQAKKDVKNYIRRLKTYLKKNNLPELKYIYVIEFVDEEEQHKSKKIRVHHHVIINSMDRDIAEDLWAKGRAEAKRLEPDDFGLEGIARYMLKLQKGSKRWYASRNLKKPEVYRAVTKLTRRKAENMARNQNELQSLFESLYSNKYQFNDCKTFLSDITGGFYLYCRMRKKE